MVKKLECYGHERSKDNSSLVGCAEKPVLKMTLESISPEAALFNGVCEVKRYRIHACGPHAHVIFTREAGNILYVDKRPIKNVKVKKKRG